MRLYLQLLFVTVLAVVLASPAWAVPAKFTQQGRLLDTSGQPLTGTHGLFFTLYDAETGGAQQWSEYHSAIFDNGYYTVTLGEVTPLDDLLFSGAGLWLDLSVDGVTLTPRQELASVPWALRAISAENVDGGVVDAAEISINGTQVIDSSGAWVGPAPTVDWSNLNSIPADLADGDQNTDILADLVCLAGEVAKWNGSAWACAVDIDTDTTIPDTTDPNTDTLLGLACADGYIAKFNGTSAVWECALDADSFADLEGTCLAGAIPVLDTTSGEWACGTDQDTVTSSLPWSSITGVPDFVEEGGDTMTGPLNLPADGLTVADNQLVLSGGQVGVGTDLPQAPLHVAGMLVQGTDRGTISHQVASFFTNDQGNDFIHIRTPFNPTQSSDMFHFEVKGYAYASTTKVVDITFVGYAYSTTQSISNTDILNPNGGHAPAIYQGSDNNVYLRFKPTSHYYLTFRVDSMHVGNGRIIEPGEVTVTISSAPTL